MVTVSAKKLPASQESKSSSTCQVILAKFSPVHSFAACLVQDLFHVIPYLVIFSAFLFCFLPLFTCLL